VAPIVKYGATLIFGAALCSALSGCTGPLVYRPKKPVIKPVPASSIVTVKTSPLPPLPDPKTNNATPAGIDTTGVGVRDDVHVWIYANYTTAKKRTPLMAMARELQVVVAIPPKTAADAKKLEQSFNDALLKLRGVPGLQSSDAENMNRSLYVRIFNTPQRLKLYLEYNLLLEQGKGRKVSEVESCCLADQAV